MITLMTGNAAVRLPAEAGEPPPGDAAPPPPGQTDDRSMHFVFEHKVFGMPNAYFALSSDRKPMFHVTYGDLHAQIEIRSLRRGFAIEPKSPDDRMLDVVERSLRFVREIRPNDSIPREVLDGTASWATDESHRAAAHGRLTLQLASWMTGNIAYVKRNQIASLTNNPAVIERVQKAVSEIAQRIGIANEEKHLIIDRIAAYAKELSYVEAIRERFENVRAIEQKIAKLVSMYKNDRLLGENLMRVAALIKGPIGSFDMQFTALDKSIADIVGICQNYDEKVVALRKTRDDLFEQYMMWQPTLETWESLSLDNKDDKSAEEAVRNIFQFLARHYPQQTAWKRR